MRRHFKHNYLISLLLMVVPSLLFAQQNVERLGACIMRDNIINGINEDKCFAMHSVMKFPQALYIAEDLNRKGIDLNETVIVKKADLIQDTWSPMMNLFEDKRYFSYAELLELALTQSDNNACDLLFKYCGKPKNVEKYMRKQGFENIHIRWTEKQMHKDASRAFDNNCTPTEMARLFEWFYLHKEDNKYMSFVWKTMANCSTGLERIPAAIPAGSSIIHKTGTGFPSPKGTQDINDAGIIIMPDGSLVIVAVFIPDSTSESEIANIAKRLLFNN